MEPADRDFATVRRVVYRVSAAFGQSDRVPIIFLSEDPTERPTTPLTIVEATGPGPADLIHAAAILADSGEGEAVIDLPIKLRLSRLLTHGEEIALAVSGLIFRIDDQYDTIAYRFRTYGDNDPLEVARAIKKVEKRGEEFRQMILGYDQATSEFVTKVNDARENPSAK